MNPVLMAIAAGAGFVARAFSGDQKHLTEIMKQAIEYPGYALVDILQPCVTFNKVNTFAYYKSRVYHIDDEHDPSNQIEAMKLAMEFDEKIPIGVIYREEKESFHQKNKILAGREPLVDRKRESSVINDLINEFV